MDYSESLLKDSNVFGESPILSIKIDSAGREHDSIDKEILSSPSPPRSWKKKLVELKPDPVDEKEAEILQKLVVREKTVPTVQIYKSVLNKIGGKDRLAKTLYYVLSLIKLYLTSTRKFLITEKLDNLSIEPILFFKNPIKYLKVMILLNFTTIEKFLANSTNNLSLFRRMMRFGGTVHRINGFLEKFNRISKNPSLSSIKSNIFTHQTIGDLINLYYGVCDELVLLYKLNIVPNERMRAIAGKHEDYSWCLDIVFGQYNNLNNLRRVREQILQLEIQQQVKQKAVMLSKKLIENIDSSPIRSQILREFNNKSPLNNHTDIEKEIEELRHEERLIHIDLVRLSFDAVCDTIDIFKLKLNPSIYLVCGACSGALGLTKVWITSKKELQDK